MLSLFNSLTKKKESFRPLKGRTVRVYGCGPTVYDFAHIGNLRTYIFEDVLRRVLLQQGFGVKHVMNITDVGHLTGDGDTGEDKLELAAGRQKKSASDLAEQYTAAFLADLDHLNILRPHEMPRATATIAEQIALVQQLEQRGYAYRTSDGMYFDTEKFPAYGKAFKGQRLEDKQAGARVEVRIEKRSPHDFALWKLTPNGVTRQQEWASPWGRGFPGWHLECSAMSRLHLGQPFDIHCGGIDHIPVHHTNEIAQSEAAYDAPLAKTWLHGAFLTVDGGRMGKSEGNLVTVSEIVEHGFEPLAYRMLVLGSGYRSTLNFTWESLAAAQAALDRLRDIARSLPVKPSRLGTVLKPKAMPWIEKVRAAAADDLNTPKAIARLWDCLKTGIDDKAKAAVLFDADDVLGLGLAAVLGKPLHIPEDVHTLVAKREEARFAKDWPRADRLRAQIEALGWLVEDAKDGPAIKEKRGR